jgi:hypothetical protein
MSDWGQKAPGLEAVTEACKMVEEHGLDIHTITVMIDNGEWRVTILATDDDMENAKVQFMMDTHGGVDLHEVWKEVVRA